MAQVFQAPNENREEVEAYIAEKTAWWQAWEAKRAKSRPLLLTLCIVLMVAAVVAVLIVLFYPGVLKGMTTAVRETLFGWSDEVSYTYDDLQNEDFSGDFDERMRGFLPALLELILRFIGSTLLMLVGWVSPVLVTLGLLAAAYGIVRLCCAGIGEIGWRAASPTDIQKRVKYGMPTRIRELQAGVEGELRALEAVEGLNDECFVFANVVIRLDGGKNETDLIVVSPTGLTVVEVKNYSGTLLGDLSDEELIQRKYRRKGKFSDSKRSNPLHQIDAPAQRLEKFLQRRGIAVNVRRCALFINEKVELKLTDKNGLAQSCPLFVKGAPALLPYLHSRRTQTLSDEDIREIVSALRTLL